MDQRIRLTAAGAVMLAGLGLAMCFRHGAAETAMTIPAQTDSLASRKQPDPRSMAANQLAPPPRVLPIPQEHRSLPPAVVKPSEEPAPPPEFSKSYPAANQTASSRWGASMAEMLPEAASTPPTHKIVDGDSLAMLAQRYLGSEARAMEIYQANRNVLAHPDILPIGAELKIPRTDQSASTR